jgi:hypothetical protein
MATQAVNRLSALDDWLERVGARKVWTTSIEGTDMTMTGYLINGRMAIVQGYGKGNGWELFTPASNDNRVASTLDAAATALGVEGCRGIEGVE